MKKYFELYSDEGICCPLKHWKDEANNRGTDIELCEAEIEYGTEYFWCSEHQAFGLKDEGGCGKECEDYKPRNRKSGRCVHSKHSYASTDKELTVTKENQLIVKTRAKS